MEVVLAYTALLELHFHEILVLKCEKTRFRKQISKILQNSWLNISIIHVARILGNLPFLGKTSRKGVFFFDVTLFGAAFDAFTDEFSWLSIILTICYMNVM